MGVVKDLEGPGEGCAGWRKTWEEEGPAAPRTARNLGRGAAGAERGEGNAPQLPGCGGEEGVGGLPS